MYYSSQFSFHFYFFKDFIYLFLERGRKGEKHQCVVASHTPPNGDLACNPGMCPDWESNQPQASAQPTEPHQPGLIFIFKELFLLSDFFSCSLVGKIEALG